jgi:hypothetical protein
MATKSMLLIDQDAIPAGIRYRADKEWRVDTGPGAKQRSAFARGVAKLVLAPTLAVSFAMHCGRQRGHSWLYGFWITCFNLRDGKLREREISSINRGPVPKAFLQSSSMPS